MGSLKGDPGSLETVSIVAFSWVFSIFFPFMLFVVTYKKGLILGLDPVALCLLTQRR